MVRAISIGRRVFPPICDRSVWYNGKHPQAGGFNMTDALEFMTLQRHVPLLLTIHHY